MPDYFITGKKGNGKSLCAVGRIRDYIRAGRPVATNLDIFLDRGLTSPMNKTARIIRIPDKPKVEDFEILGSGNPTYDEEKNGGIFLDELGTWFNSRTWNDKNRQKVIDWLLHARKLGWDVFYLVQDISLVDKQAREALAEHVVYCRRLDRLNIPFVGFIYRTLTGSKFPLPRVHVGAVKYGDGPQALIVDRWVYRGNDLFSCYDTKQCFTPNYPNGPFSYLPSWYFRRRSWSPRSKEFYMRLTKIYFRQFSKINLFFIGLFLGFLTVGGYFFHQAKPVEASVKPVPVVIDDAYFNKLREMVVVGVSRLPGRSPDVFLGLENDVKTSSTELVKRGFSCEIFKNKIIVSAGSRSAVFRF